MYEEDVKYDFTQDFTEGCEHKDRYQKRLKMVQDRERNVQYFLALKAREAKKKLGNKRGGR